MRSILLEFARRIAAWCCSMAACKSISFGGAAEPALWYLAATSAGGGSRTALGRARDGAKVVSGVSKMAAGVGPPSVSSAPGEDLPARMADTSLEEAAVVVEPPGGGERLVCPLSSV